MKAKIAWTKPVKSNEWERLNFNQRKVSGFSLAAFQNAKVLSIGAGAIGTNVLLGLVRKGIGALDIFDDDSVELNNLTRQLFSLRDIGKNKAECLAKFLSKQGFFRTRIRGFPYRYQEALEFGYDFSSYDAVICGVDNNPTRTSVAKYCLEKKIPLVMGAISRDGIQMYCAVQEPEKACFGCIRPNEINDDSYPCNLPGIIDINLVVAGFMVYALDTILMNRHREWNLKMVFLDGSVPETSKIILRNADCQLCNNKNK
jgi:molybdopterin/thiamine biosynthesis adenylyltransferase